MKLASRVCGRAVGAVLMSLVSAAAADAQAQLWSRQIGTSGHDLCFALAPDGAGGVFLCGSTDGSFAGPHAGGVDVWLARYDGTGVQSWIRQFGTSTDDWAKAAAVDGAGGVYVSGWTFGSLGGTNAGSSDVWIARYDSGGNQTWLRQLGTSAANWGNALAHDGAGGVFVSGGTSGSLGGPHAGGDDAWLARYDGAGNQTWIRQFGTSSLDESKALAPDGAGGVYVSGWTLGSLGGPNIGLFDAWIARYDGAGSQTWVRQLGSDVTEDSQSVASDGAGGLFVSGWTYGSFGGAHAGGADVWVARYDAWGSQAWLRQFGTDGEEHSFAVVPDGTGGVYVSCRTSGSLGGPNSGETDAALARYDGAGNRIWLRQFGSIDSDHLYALAADGGSGVYVSGNTSGSFGGPTAGGADVWLARYDGGPVTARYCSPAVSNSTGQPSVLNAYGSSTVAANDITLEATSLSLNSFGFFLTSRDQGNVFPVNNSQGRLCLGGLIGRYVGPGQVQNSGPTGSFSLALDLTNMAHPFNPVSAQPGQTWYFQAWHRDANPTLTSNFTDAVSITFN